MKRNKITQKLAIIVVLILSVVGINYGIINKIPALLTIKLQLKQNIMLWKYSSPDEKLWAHRCDSILKLNEQTGIFSGVELDICFFLEKDEFDVSHDLHDNVDYPLEDFMTVLGESNFKVWLDFKNLTADNEEAARHRLNELFEKYDIDKSRAIVESHNVNELAKFKADGWYTSYYCPTDEKYLRTVEGNEDFIGQVRAAVATGNVSAVSFPVEYYDIVKKAEIPVDMLTWDMGAKWWSYKIDAHRKKLLDDNQLKVILVTSGSAYNR